MLEDELQAVLIDEDCYCCGRRGLLLATRAQQEGVLFGTKERRARTTNGWWLGTAGHHLKNRGHNNVPPPWWANDGDSARCPTCLFEHTISVDEGVATVGWDEQSAWNVACWDNWHREEAT